MGDEAAGRARRAGADCVERALATGHGEAYLASAVYSMNLGDFERAGRDLGHALLRAPMSAHAHELAGRVLVRILVGWKARHHFEVALGLDPAARRSSRPTSHGSRRSRTGCAANARVAELLADPHPPIAQLGNVFRARLAAWRGDAATMLDAATRFALAHGRSGRTGSCGSWRKRRRSSCSRETWMKFVDAFSEIDSTRLRQQLMGQQLLIQVALTRGQLELSRSRSSAIAARTGLMDIVRRDRCPLVGTVARTMHGMQRCGRSSKARAERVLAALRSVTS